MTIFDRLESAAFTVAERVARFSPALALRVCAPIARAIGPISPFDARAREGMEQAFPDLTDAERREIRVGMYDNFTRTAIEHLMLPRLLDDPGAIRIEGRAHVDAALAARRGILFMTAHFGNWEAARIAAARCGAPPALLRRQFNNPVVEARAMELIGYLDAPIYHKGAAGFRETARRLRKREAAMMLIDQRLGRSPLLPFLGIPAATTTAAAELALAYGAAFMPVRAQRIGRASRFLVTFEPPIEPDPTLSRQDAALAMTAALNDRYSAWIREAPEQWFWLHRRWGKPKRRHSTGL